MSAPRKAAAAWRTWKSLRDVLARKGWQEGRDLHFEVIPGAEHNEAAWAQRVGPFLQFLFPSGETGSIIRCIVLTAEPVLIQ